MPSTRCIRAYTVVRACVWVGVRVFLIEDFNAGGSEQARCVFNWKFSSSISFALPTVTSPSDVGLKANDDTKLTRAQTQTQSLLIESLHTQLYIRCFCCCPNRKKWKKWIEIRWRNENRRLSSHSWDVIPLIRKSCFLSRVKFSRSQLSRDNM